MFDNCHSLTTAPELPATTLVNGCYQRMFDSCRNLNYIKSLATTGISTSSLQYWCHNVQNVSGTFVKDANATWPTADTSGVYGGNGVPNNWTIIDA